MAIGRRGNTTGGSGITSIATANGFSGSGSPIVTISTTVAANSVVYSDGTAIKGDGNLTWDGSVFNINSISPIPTQEYHIPVTGNTITIASFADAIHSVIVNPAAAIANLTIGLPDGQFDGQILNISVTQAITGGISLTGNLETASLFAGTAQLSTVGGCCFVWNDNLGQWTIGLFSKVLATGFTGTLAAAIAGSKNVVNGIIQP